MRVVAVRSYKVQEGRRTGRGGWNVILENYLRQHILASKKVYIKFKYNCRLAIRDLVGKQITSMGHGAK